MQLYTVYFICKLLYMFRVVSPPIISSTNNYLQHLALVNRCCYLSVLWSLNSSTVATGSNNG